MRPARHEPWVLAIDAVSSCCALAIAHGHWLRAYAYTHSPLSLSRRLLPMLHTCLEHVERELTEFDIIAVNRGPGSFTGLRITFSTLKAFYSKHPFKVVALDTLSLQVLCWPGKGTVWSMIPAGRTEYALARYKKENPLMFNRETEITRGTWFQIYPHLQHDSNPILYPEPGVIPMAGSERLVRIHERTRVEALLTAAQHPEIFPRYDRIEEVELLYLRPPDIRPGKSILRRKSPGNPQ